MIYTFDLTGKVVLVTGGYGYLGTAISESLAWHGASVYVLARSPDKFDAAFAGTPGEIDVLPVGQCPEGKAREGAKRSAGRGQTAAERFESSTSAARGSIRFQPCDISDSGSIAAAFKAVNEQEGAFDVLVNNAFYLDGSDPLGMSDEEWQSGIDGTLNSVYRCIREALPYLKKSKVARIINVSSMYGMTAPDFSVYEGFEEMRNPPHYGAAKAGVLQVSRYYASLLGSDGITVNSVTPGPFPPPEVQKKKKFIENLEKQTSLNRIGRPEDLAGAFVFLASDASGYITGQNIVVDGGWTAT